MSRLHRKYCRHERFHKMLWTCLTIITIIVVLCDVFLYIQDKKEKNYEESIQHSRVVKNHKPSKLDVVNRPKNQHWPQDKQSRESKRYQNQAKQDVDNANVNPQTKQKLLAAFDGLMPNQQKHVLGIINSGMSNQDKITAIKSYIMGN